MNFKLFKNKLKSEKGVTGIDIVVASTIILVSFPILIILGISTNVESIKLFSSHMFGISNLGIFL